jgi:hypothetical protein
MKKLIYSITVTLFFLNCLDSYSQNVNLVINNIIPIDLNLHKTANTALTVPNGKIWVIQSLSGNGSGAIISVLPIGFSSYANITPIPSSTIPVYLTAGTKLYINNSPLSLALFHILEFNAPSTQTGTLALNEVKEINNKKELFPNPTNSKIALNSEKDYNIEIYNMQGQIVMKANGNTIDLSNLSNAVYILKAYDNYEKTTTSYKVVKN